MHPVSSRKARRLVARLGAVAALGLAAVPFTASAQVATTSGYLSNFDVVNHTGQDACGFEVELHGIQASQIYSDYSWQRFGTSIPAQGNPPGVTNPPGSITATPYGSVVVRYAATVSEDGSCSTKTVPRPNGNFVGTCYMNTDSINGGFAASYESSGCEHFGIHTSVGPSKTTYHWLVVDPVTKQLVPHVDNLPIAAPVFMWNPPAAVGGEPQLVAEIEAADPPENPEVYGDAQWVRITKTKLSRDAVLAELRTDDPLIEGAQVEIDWELLQQEPASGGQRRRGKGTNSDSVNGSNTRAIIRRYETYAYSGTYDPVTHEATCVNLDVLTGNCTAPADGELGDYIGANMVAANVDVNGVWVSRAGAGAGTVSSTDRIIDCGNKCSATYDAGTLVSLTVKPDSKSTFAGWGGACTGTGGCTVTAGEGVNVTATFASTRTATGGGGGGGTTGGTTGLRLSVTLNGKGAVTSAPAAINCGKTCSATVVRGSSYTLTATPEAGNAFGGWTGACAAAGTSPRCEVMVGTQAISVGATFTRVR